jgi:multimeric flavodoxin WrbA
MNALVIYWSATGNTKKVAETIHETLKNSGVNSILKRFEEAKAEELELYDYDLLLIGSPSYMWQPPGPVQDYIKEKVGHYHKRGDIKYNAPKLPGKTGVAFVTYSGPHTGINEAIPVGKYFGQFFDGEFHNNEEASTQGRLGDIRGRPNKQDLDNVAREVNKLLKTLAG